MLVRIAGQPAVSLKDGRLESGRAFVSTFTYSPLADSTSPPGGGGHGVSTEDTPYVVNKTLVLVERGLELSPETAPGLGGRMHLRE